MRRSRWLDASAPVQRWPDLLRPVCNGSGGTSIEGDSRDGDDAIYDRSGADSAVAAALAVSVRTRGRVAIAPGRRASSVLRARWPAASARDGDASGQLHVDATR